MINSTSKENKPSDPTRRLLITGGFALVAGSLLGTSREKRVLAETRGEAAVRVTEITHRTTKGPNGDSESWTFEPGNDYVLSLAQNPTSRALMRIGQDGVARERVKIMHADGSHIWKDGGSVFVFEGISDTQAYVKVRDCDDPCNNKVTEELKPALLVRAYRVRNGGRLEEFMSFPTAIGCEPREQRFIDSLSLDVKPEPSPTPIPTTKPKQPPVQVPVQLPRGSAMLLSEEFGLVANTTDLGRVIYE